MSYPSTKLCFTLPEVLALVIQPGRHQPCLHGCVLNVHRHGLVTIDGPDTAQVIAQVSRFLKTISKNRMVDKPIAVTITGPEGRDRGWMTVRAAVSFSWGGVEPVVEFDAGRVA